MTKTIEQLALQLAQRHAALTGNLDGMGKDMLAAQGLFPLPAEIAFALASKHDKLTQVAGALGGDFLAAYTLIAAAKPPVVVPPEIDPPVIVPPTSYGCPPGLVLKEWISKLVTGGGIPAGVNPFASGSVCEAIHYKGNPADGYYTHVGMGGPGPYDNAELRNSIIEQSDPWGARMHRVVRARSVNVSTINTPREHDYYPEPIANGRSKEENAEAYKQALLGKLPFDSALIYFLLHNGYSENAGSQRFQQAQRERDGLTLADMECSGLLWIHGDLCVNHASPTGTGTRQSQAYKAFSSQIGPSEGNEDFVTWKGHALFERIDLDDTMQEYSNGALMLGRSYGTTVRDSRFRGGKLIQEAVRIAEVDPDDVIPCGLLVIENCEFTYASGEGGQGITVLDLKRPILIQGCNGNIRIKGPNGEHLAHISEGYSQGV